MAVETRNVGTEDEGARTVAPHRMDALERAMGAILLVAGAVAFAWAIPFALRYPMALAVAASVTAIGAGVVWRKPWAFSGLLCLGLLLCSGSIGYLLVQGVSPVTFAWAFFPGAYFMWVGIRGIRDGRRITAPV